MTLNYKNHLITIDSKNMIVTRLSINPMTIIKKIDKDLKYSEFIKILNNLIKLEDNLFKSLSEI